MNIVTVATKYFPHAQVTISRRRVIISGESWKIILRYVRSRYDWPAFTIAVTGRGIPSRPWYIGHPFGNETEFSKLEPQLEIARNQLKKDALGILHEIGEER